jgi:hypothetical protein
MRAREGAKPCEERDELLDRIRAALSDDPGRNVTALSLALVEQALQLRRNDGTVGTSMEVKASLHQLTGGMVDICAEAGPPEQWESHDARPRGSEAMSEKPTIPLDKTGCPDLQALIERAGRRYAASIGEEYVDPPLNAAASETLPLKTIMRPKCH